MPLYEYFCPECRSPFSARRSFADYEQPATCPACGCEDGRRVLSNVVAFSTDASGSRRVVAGGPSCAGCASSPVGCSGGCGIRR